MKDILHDIQQYNPHLTISKVVAFFERKGLTITKSMIQNYVRDGLLPPPVGKRYYTHKHLAVLALVLKLKTVYEMADIKAVIEPLMDAEGISLELYRQCVRSAGEIGMPQSDILTMMAYSVDVKDEALRRIHNV